MADNYPSTQRDDDGDNIMALIGNYRLEEEEEETKTERGTPVAVNENQDTREDVEDPPSDVSSCLNSVVARLISKANTIGMDTKFPFPPLSDIQKMTEQEYVEMQQKLQAFSYIKFANNVRHQNELKAYQIQKDIEKYKTEASRFRMLSPGVMSKFAESRLGFSKLQDVINIYKSLMQRIVLLGDFPNSASNYVQYPDIITFAKKITEPNDIEPRFMYVDPETAATPGPGNRARTIYTAQWIASKAESATREKPIPDPLNIYETGEMWKHISQELQDKHVGRIHPNLVRPLYLNIPITEPAWEDQHGERHVNTFDIEALDHDDPWAVYIRDYNRI